MTSVTELSRETRIKEAVANVHHYPHEKRSVKLRGQDVLLPSVPLPVDLVLLNHQNHRIRAQMSALPAAERNEIAANPHSQKSQDALEKLVKSTDGFDEVLAVMSNEPQREPGIITSKGVLINANTRTVALRSNKRTDTLNVLVLPPDVSNRELLDLEFTLQMQRESKQDYSFSNRLLFIAELLEADRQPADIGRLLDPSLNPASEPDKKKARSSVEREMRLLTLANLVVSGSQGRLPMTWFDDKRQALIEIDADYEALVKRDAAEARRVRGAQLAAMISGVDYRMLRHVDARLVDSYLTPALESQAALKDHAGVLLEAGPDVSSGKLPPGLDILMDSPFLAHNGASSKPSLDRVFQMLARSADDDEVFLPALKGAVPASLARDVFTAAFSRGVEVAIDNRKHDDAKSDALTAPVQFLEDACQAIDKARRAHLNAIGRNPDLPAQAALTLAALPGYDVNAVQDKLEAVERALEDLKAELS